MNASDFRIHCQAVIKGKIYIWSSMVDTFLKLGDTINTAKNKVVEGTRTAIDYKQSI